MKEKKHSQTHNLLSNASGTTTKQNAKTISASAFIRIYKIIKRAIYQQEELLIIKQTKTSSIYSKSKLMSYMGISNAFAIAIAN